MENNAMSDLISKTIANIEPTDSACREAAIEHISRLTMPPWALGRLLDVAVDLAGMTRSMEPPTTQRTAVVVAGDHGVVAEGVSAFPQEVTVQMVHNFVNGGAGINVLAQQAGAVVVVVDAGVAGDLSDLVEEKLIVNKRVAPGTSNMAKGPAMSREQAVRSVEAGIEVALDLANQTDLFATGDMGIGNTTPSSAIVSVLCDMPSETVTGCGTGIDEPARRQKADTISKAITLNKPDPSDALDVLAKVGGFEIGTIAGLILAAASRRKPILVDGFISTAGALIAQGLCPISTDYMLAAHQSLEQGHAIALKKLDKQPLLNLDLRLGEGTGAVLCMHIVDAGVRVMTQMATFDDAGVSESAS